MFFNRYEAGQRLGEKLQAYAGSDAVVFAVPRGGVLVALEVVKALRVPLELVITRKIGHPIDREVAICAITEDGKKVCDDFGLLGVDTSWIKNESALQLKEARRQHELYLVGHVCTPATNKTVILVDDGIATGLTIKAAILSIKRQNPKTIIVAVPVASESVMASVESLVDGVVVTEIAREPHMSVGSYYTQFDDVADKEVVACLAYAKKFIKPQSVKREIKRPLKMRNALA